MFVNIILRNGRQQFKNLKQLKLTKIFYKFCFNQVLSNEVNVMKPNQMLVFLASLSVVIAQSQLVLRNNMLEVANGRQVFVSRDNLLIDHSKGFVCRVQVVQNEPMHQKVGTFHPEVSLIVTAVKR